MQSSMHGSRPFSVQEVISPEKKWALLQSKADSRVRSVVEEGMEAHLAYHCPMTECPITLPRAIWLALRRLRKGQKENGSQDGPCAPCGRLQKC
jgi:hypothetical protein